MFLGMVPAGDEAADTETVVGKRAYGYFKLKLPWFSKFELLTLHLRVVFAPGVKPGFDTNDICSIFMLLTQYTFNVANVISAVEILIVFQFHVLPVGEEALTMYLAKNKLDRKLVNATQNVEALHQLASSYFIDRDGTMRKLHEIQISTNAIKVGVHYYYCYLLFLFFFLVGFF